LQKKENEAVSSLRLMREEKFRNNFQKTCMNFHKHSEGDLRLKQAEQLLQNVEAKNQQFFQENFELTPRIKIEEDLKPVLSLRKNRQPIQEFFAPPPNKGNTNETLSLAKAQNSQVKNHEYFGLNEKPKDSGKVIQSQLIKNRIDRLN
jgi:hypothetical protein